MLHRQFDIISGEPRRKYKSENKMTPRVQSYDVLGQSKLQHLQHARQQLPKLGRSKDYRKEFSDGKLPPQDFQPGRLFEPNDATLTNSVSTNYNIINHTRTVGHIYTKQMPQVNFSDMQHSRIAYKREAISKICDLGRLYAPNINQEFQDKLNEDSAAFRIKKGSCAEILEIGKSYGPRAKLFRRWK